MPHGSPFRSRGGKPRSRAFRDSLFLATVMLAVASVLSVAQAADPTGVWLTEDGDAKVRIAACDALPAAAGRESEPQEHCGEIVWLAEPTNPQGRPVVDRNNPDPALRERPILGLLILHGFVAAPPGEPWEGGRIYNPKDGEVYRAVLTPRDGGDRLEVRGYVGLPLFGQTQVWSRHAP